MDPEFRADDAYKQKTKWEGIQGTGVTRGMFKQRSDDHSMLKSELHWNLPR